MSGHEARPWPGAVEWGGDWLAEAAADLAHLGFELRDGSLPGTRPGPRLLVALRDVPTLEHFDPEEVTFWEAHLGRGRLASLDRRRPTPYSQPFSWGRVQVVDRIPVTNQFLTFGGTLLVDALDDRQIFAAFVSKAPIVRWAGHSQGVDPLVDEIGAFFARLMVPIDYEGGAEAIVGQADPRALYAAFVQDAWRRFAATPTESDAEPELATWARREGHHLEATDPEAVRAGRELRIRLGLRPG